MAGRSLKVQESDEDAKRRRAEVAAAAEGRVRVAIERAAHNERTRLVPLTKERRERFLSILACGWTVSKSAQMAGVAERTLYDARARDEDFRERWQLALEASVEPLEERLGQIAYEGDLNSMAAVKAAELLLGKRDRAYRRDRTMPITARLRQRGDDGTERSLEVSTGGFTSD